MIGFESYGYGGCSSNLSAHAPPFTVDRTVLSLNSNPSANFINEPPPPPYSGATYNSSLHSWVPSNPTPMADYYTNFNSEVDSMPRPIRDNYLLPVPPLINTGVNESRGAFSYAQYTDSVTTAVNLAQPYSSSYASPAIEEKDPLVQLGDSTYDFLSSCCIAPSDRTYQDDYRKKVSGWGGSTRWDDSWNGFKDLESGNYPDLNWSSSFYSSEKNVAGPPMCMDYMKPGASKYDSKYDEVKKSGPALFLRPPAIGTCSSQLNMDLSRQNEDYSHISDLVVNYPHLSLNSDRYETSTNPSRFSLYLEKDGGDDANTSLSLSKKMVPGPLISNKSLSQAIEFHLPRTSSPNGSPSILDEAKVVDSVDNSSKSLDIYNTAVDSPCWKGASSSRFSCFEDSNAFNPQPLKERSSDLRDGSQKLSESFSCNPSRSIESRLSPSMKRTSFKTYSYGEDGRLNSTKPGTFVPEQNCNGIFSSNSIKPLHQDIDLTFEKCAFRDCSEESGKNPEESSGIGSSHAPICDTEDDTSNLTKLGAKESAPKIDFAVLLKTMQNLSDLIVFYCSNEEYVLKEQDNMTLKHVINNLNSCMQKIPQFTLKRKSGFSRDLHQDNNGNSKIHNQHAHEKKMHNILACMKDEKFQNFVTVASDITKPDEITQAIKKALTENFNGEEGTLPQALLYKNLWLEAEAVICSTNFKTRFDRIKSEMEKSKLLEAKDGSQDVVNMEKFSHSKVYPDVKMVDNLTTNTNYSIQDSPMISNTSPPGDVMARFCILKSRGFNSISMNPTDSMIDSSSNVITGLKEVDTLPSETMSCHPATPITSTTNHEDDVIARFHILKSQVDNLTSMNPTNLINGSSSTVFPGLRNINTLASDAKSFIPASPIINTTNHEDDVISRFRMLQSRGDSSTSPNLTYTTKPSSSKEFPSLKDLNTLASNICIQGSSPISIKPHPANDADDSVLARLSILKCRDDKKDENFDMGKRHDLQNPVDQCNEDKLYVNDAALFRNEMASQSFEEDEVENPHNTGWYDSPSLDWEHVLKDDFVW